MKKLAFIAIISAFCLLAGIAHAGVFAIRGPRELVGLAESDIATVTSYLDQDEEGVESLDGIYFVSPKNDSFDIYLEGEKIRGDQYTLPPQSYNWQKKGELTYSTGDTIPCASQMIVVFEPISIGAAETRQEIVRNLADTVIASGEQATILKTGRGFSYEKGTINVVELLSDDVQSVLGDILPDATIGAMKMVKIWWTERPEHTDPNKPEEEPTTPSSYREYREGWGGGGGCDALSGGLVVLAALGLAARKKRVCWLLCMSVMVLAVCVAAAWADVPIDEAHFPDPVFREFVKRRYDGYEEEDNILSDYEIERVTSIGLNGVNHEDERVSSLEGIEYLTALEYLYCYGHNLTTLDVSGCTSLKSLDCFLGNLISLDVSGCTALENLDCHDNNLTTLDLSGCTSLRGLDCHDNNLISLDVSGCTALENLDCYDNNLTSLNVSGCVVLRILYCYTSCWEDYRHNNLTTLDLSSCTALEDLLCHANHLTTLDLSKNTSLSTFVDLGDFGSTNEPQTISGLKVTVSGIIDKTYQVYLSDYVPKDKLKNIVAGSIEGFDSYGYGLELLSYNATTGVAVFNKLPTSVWYSYQTHSPNNDVMDVVIEKSNLTIDALERGGVSTTEGICDASQEGYYLDFNGKRVTEAAVAPLGGAFVKTGLTADGNTRLILRVQSEKPGTVRFSVPPEIGATLEDLNRDTSAPASGIPTVEINTGLFKKAYQASAVLIAPKDFPKPLTFPEDTFSVTVHFTDEDGKTETTYFPLTLCAAPVVLIHGLWGDATGTFNIGKDTGVYHKLSDAGLTVGYLNYNGAKGPTDLIINKEGDDPLTSKLASVFAAMNRRGIACTRADLVTHSMGGLVARAFLDHRDGKSDLSYKQSMIRRVVTIGTPHKGSPWGSYFIGDFDGMGLNRWTEGREAEVAGYLKENHDNIRSTFYKLMAGKGIYLDNKFVSLNADSAMTDLALGSALVNSLKSSSRPIHAIYGVIHDDLVKTLPDMLESKVHGNVVFNKVVSYLPHEVAAVALFVPMVLSKTHLPALLHVLFGNDDSDFCVGHDSAVSGVYQENSTGYPQGTPEAGYWNRYWHGGLCAQDDVGARVVELLSGPESEFDRLGSMGASPVKPLRSAVLMLSAAPAGSENAGLDPEEYFVEKFAVTLDKSAAKVSNGETDVVTITATAKEEPVNGDVFMMVTTSIGAKIFRVSSADGGRTFKVSIQFSDADTGVMNAFCFAQVDGEHVYVSNSAPLVVAPELEDENIEELTFLGTDRLITDVNSEVAIGLFVRTKDGRLYDISSPAMGTDWMIEAPEIAEVTETGRVLGLKQGQTTLVAEYANLSAAISVDVSLAASSVTPDNPPTPGPVMPNTPAPSTPDGKTDNTTPTTPDNKQDNGNGSKDTDDTSDSGGGGGGGCDAGLGAGALTLFALAVAMMKRKIR